jgi:hypothetical protein
MMMTGKTKRRMMVSSMFVVCGTRVREVIWIHRPPPPVVVQQLTNEWLMPGSDGSNFHESQSRQMGST